MFALSCALLIPQAAHAQWAVQDSNGNAIPSDGSGSYPLVVNATGHTTNTYSQALLDDVQAGRADPIWLGCFTPHPSGNPYQNYPNYGPDWSGLITSSGTIDLTSSVTANNYTTLTYGTVAGTYSNVSGAYPLNGGVSLDATAPLFAKFIWSPNIPRTPAPDHLDVLVDTNLEVNAYIARSGLSAAASASAVLGPVNELLIADTSDPDTQIVVKKQLVRLPVSRNSVTLSGQSGVGVSASNGVSYNTDGQASANGYGNVSVSVKPDTREVALRRDGAHNETVDPDGTVHGDTTYSYLIDQENTGGEGPPVLPFVNTQYFHPVLSGAWSHNYHADGAEYPDVLWNWSPSGSGDTEDTAPRDMPFGSPEMDSGWVGSSTGASSPMTITYTVTDNGNGELYNNDDHATATAHYVLTVHDQYDNWRRVDGHGGSLSSSAPGDSGALVEQGQTTSPVPAGPATINVQNKGVSWSVLETNGGGVLSGAGTVVSAFTEAPKTPTWVGVALQLAGLLLQTAGSQPSDSPVPVNSPDALSASFLQSAYQNYLYNQTAVPGEENNSNLVDSSLAAALGHHDGYPDPDFSGYYAGNHGTVSVTTTLYLQMLNYYLLADEYDAGGLVQTGVPSTVHKPGGNVWTYLWTYIGDTTPPSQPVQ